MRRATVRLIAIGGGLSAVLACSGYEGGGDARIAPLASGDGGSDAATVVDSGARADSGDSGSTRDELTTNLVASYRFDGDVNDSSGAGHHLRLTGSNTGAVTYPDGIVGNAVRLPDGATYLSLVTPDDSALALGNADFTMQAWVKLQQIVPTSETVLLGKYSGSTGWRFSLRDTGAVFHAPPLNDFVPKQAATAGAWHHIVMRRRSSSFDITYDGMRQSTTMSATASIASVTGAPLVIGQAGPLPSSPGPRFLDEVALWKRALTDSEIARLYNGGAGLSVGPQQ